MKIEGTKYDPITDFNTVTMKSNPFIFTKILKNNVWIKELQIKEDDIIFFDTCELFNTLVQCQHLTVVNLSKNIKGENSISLVWRIYPKVNKQGQLVSDFMEYKMITWDEYDKLKVKSNKNDNFINL